MDNNKDTKLRELLSEKGKKIAVLAHSNPDGDAIGSALALGRLLEKLGHEVICAVPNRYPYFLSWMAGINKLEVFKLNPDPVAKQIAEAQIIFCVDFNNPARLELLSETMAANTSASRVLIDHHLQPAPDFDLAFSDPTASSTCYLIYTLIDRIYGTDIIDTQMAESLFVGIMTDTGNFSFSNLTPELFRAVAVLIEKGLNVPKVNSQVYNSFTEGRMRLMGYALNRKMEIVDPYNAAYISLTEAELRRFDFQVGDTEGFVNMPLSIETIVMSAMFVQTRQFIRVSLRSRGDVDVNLFARDYFNGGGHKNAAGGKSFMSMSDTITHYREGLKTFFKG